MSIPCDHVNQLPQTLLNIDKTLITDPNDVSVYINLSHLDSLDTIEEGMKIETEVPSPCPGGAPIKGEAYVAKVILVGGVNFSVILFDTSTMTKIYDGQIQFVTAYATIGYVKIGEEPIIDPSLVTTKFTTTLNRIDVPDPSLDYYIYTVDGSVDLIYNSPLLGP